MTRPRRLPRVLVLLVALVSGVGTVMVPAVQVTEAATDRLPDLRMARLREFRITTSSSGRKLLRFTTLMTNYGAGPFILRAQRPSTASPWKVQQVITNSAGGSRRITSAATMKYGGDGHGHWHVNRVIDVDLWSSTTRIPGSKIGFCFFDTTAVALSLPRAPRAAVYREAGCGPQSALTSLMGISVGWADRYRWSIAYQWIDITGLPNGDYRVRAWVDARNLFAESSNANNCTYTRVRITGNTVTVLGSGDVCSNDYGTHPEAAAIKWALKSGLMPACGADLFCPNERLQRAHLARYLDAALALPATTVDAFDDDAGNPDEASINRVAAAGLLDACGDRQFCPTAWATRAVTATGLARGFGLPAATTDLFVDDETQPDEESINRVAEAGAMTACATAPDHFCPDDILNRAQMAGALYRLAAN